MITNKWILGNGDISEAIALRHGFAQEQGRADTGDGFDALAIHLVIYDEDKPAASGRVFYDGAVFRIGKLVVREDLRGQGFGDLLVKLLILKAFEFSPNEVHVHSRASKTGFYEKYGFAPFGEPYDEDGEEHIPMRVTKESMVFPSQCGHDKHYGDFFAPREVDTPNKPL